MKSMQDRTITAATQKRNTQAMNKAKHAQHAKTKKPAVYWTHDRDGNLVKITANPATHVNNSSFAPFVNDLKQL